jgi:hypothetical protein
MIDLKNLEVQIDSILANETSQSLTNWLLNRRYSNLCQILGKGAFVNTGLNASFSFNTVKSTNAIFVKDSRISSDLPNNRQAA